MESARQFLPVLGVVLGWILLDRLGISSLERALSMVQLPKSTLVTLSRASRILLAFFALLLCSEALHVAPRELWSSVSTILALLAVGFVAFWSVLSNTVCGLVLFITAPFKPGDTIELFDLGTAAEKKGLVGVVKELSLFYLVLESEIEERKELNYIPHNLVFQRGIRRILS
jgi:small-conductance mechanosensitive channel